MTSRATASCVAQIASGSWVTWPGDGNFCSNGCWALATGRPSWPNAMARDDVVPWSRARTRSAAVMRRGQRVGTAGHRVLDGRRGEVSVDLGRLRGRVPAELGAEDGGHARGDGRPVVRSLLGEPRPPAQHVVERRRRARRGRPTRPPPPGGPRPAPSGRSRSSSRPSAMTSASARPVPVDEPPRHALREARVAGDRCGERRELREGRGADDRQVGGPGRTAPRLVAAERGVDRVAGHDPVGRVLAAADPDDARSRPS